MKTILTKSSWTSSSSITSSVSSTSSFGSGVGSGAGSGFFEGIVKNGNGVESSAQYEGIWRISPNQEFTLYTVLYF